MEHLPEDVIRNIFKYLDDPSTISMVTASPMSISWSLAQDNSMWKMWYMNVWGHATYSIEDRKPTSEINWRVRFAEMLHKFGPTWYYYERIRRLTAQIFHLVKTYFPQPSTSISRPPSIAEFPEDMNSFPGDYLTAIKMGFRTWSWSVEKTTTNSSASFEGFSPLPQDFHSTESIVNSTTNNNSSINPIKTVLKIRRSNVLSMITTSFAMKVPHREDLHLCDTYLEYLELQRNLHSSAVMADNVYPWLHFGYQFNSPITVCNESGEDSISFLLGYKVEPSLEHPEVTLSVVISEVKSDSTVTADFCSHSCANISKDTISNCTFVNKGQFGKQFLQIRKSLLNAKSPWNISVSLKNMRFNDSVWFEAVNLGEVNIDLFEGCRAYNSAYFRF